MIVERPVASLLAVEIDPFANLVVVNCISMAVIRKCACDRIKVRLWNVWEDFRGGRRPSTLGNNATRKYARAGLSVGRRIAASSPIWFVTGNCITQPL